MLKKEAEALDVKAYESKQISDTRFIAHEHDCLCNNFHNWPVQFKYWEDHAQELAKDKEDDDDDDEYEKEKPLKSDQITTAQNNARNLRNVKHITSFLSMLEITDVLTRA